MVETGRRKVAVSGRLENQGENAYGTTVHISTSSNLLFSSLTVKVRNHPGKSRELRSDTGITQLNRLLPLSHRTNRIF